MMSAASWNVRSCEPASGRSGARLPDAHACRLAGMRAAGTDESLDRAKDNDDERHGVDRHDGIVGRRHQPLFHGRRLVMPRAAKPVIADFAAPSLQ